MTTFAVDERGVGEAGSVEGARFELGGVEVEPEEG